MLRNRFCVVKTCEYYAGTSNPNVRMHRFPRNAKQKQRWIEIIRKANGQTFHDISGHVCDKHFSPIQIIRQKDMVSMKEEGFPDLIISNEDTNQGTLAVSENESVDYLKAENERLKLKHEMELIKLNEAMNILKIKISSVENERNVLKIKLMALHEENEMFNRTDENLKIIINCLLTGVKGSQKYPEPVREFSICLHYYSPRAYRFVRTAFNNNLPDESTIRAWYSNVTAKLGCGISKQCLDILKQRVELKRAEGSKLICSLIFDEMYIRQHTQWSNSTKQFLGLSTYGEAKGVAKEAIAFMVHGVNDEFQFPIAYQFICTITAKEKMELLLAVIDSLHNIGAIVINITFDGHSTNLNMCTQLGADLDVDSKTFKPYFETESGQKIFIWLDPCHMLKLVRNTIGNVTDLIDSENNIITWRHFEQLVEYDNKNGIDLRRKLNRRHLEWKRQPMKVRLAAETLSASTARAIEFLKDSNIPELIDANGTIKYIRFINSLFDIFNSKLEQHPETFKCALASQNKNDFLKFCQDAKAYIKGLKFIDDRNRTHVLYKSRKKIGFIGFMVNIESLFMMFEEFVEKKQLLRSISTFALCQDFIESLFGKIRSLGGFNDNPTQEHFTAACRKILVNEAITISKNGNCMSTNNNQNPASNILSVSSRKKKNDCDGIDEIPRISDVDELLNELLELEENHDNGISNNAEDRNISFIATKIEKKLNKADRKICLICSHIFQENERLQEFPEKPCVGTFKICKIANRFLRTELLTKITNFNVFYHAICDEIVTGELFPVTDFDHNEDHLFYIVRLILDAFIHIKCTHIARKLTLSQQQTILRAKLNKLIHFKGQ